MCKLMTNFQFFLSAEPFYIIPYFNSKFSKAMIPQVCIRDYGPAGGVETSDGAICFGTSEK